MYHWFLLLRAPRDPTAAQTLGAALKFFDHGSPITASLNRSERWRLVWLGAIEFIPALSGGIGACYVESGPVRVSLVIAGLFLCAVVCWLLRHKAPLTRIYSSASHANNDNNRNA
jgi:hypothetical protein